MSALATRLPGGSGRSGPVSIDMLSQDALHVSRQRSSVLLRQTGESIAEIFLQSDVDPGITPGKRRRRFAPDHDRAPRSGARLSYKWLHDNRIRFGAISRQLSIGGRRTRPPGEGAAYRRPFPEFFRNTAAAKPFGVTLLLSARSSVGGRRQSFWPSTGSTGVLSGIWKPPPTHKQVVLR